MGVILLQVSRDHKHATCGNSKEQTRVVLISKLINRSGGLNLSSEADQTDELRRLALQLALQLPANVAEARHVLKLTEDCLLNFLVEPAEASPLARARRLGWGGIASAPVAQLVVGPRPAVRAGATGLCCLVMVALGLGAGQLCFLWLGFGLVATNLVALTVIALLYGAQSALLSGLLAALLTNMVMMPPLLVPSVPTALELFGLAGYLVIGVAVPWIQARRDRLRSASLRAVERPIRALTWRRAA